MFINTSIKLLFLFTAFFGIANAGTFRSEDPQLAPVLEKLYLLDEFHTLLDEAQKEGPIDLLFVSLPEVPSKALWDYYNRRIVINSKFGFDTGRIIHSILFELQNAVATSALDALRVKAANGEVDKDSFVEGIEWIEHQNALKTKHLLEKGIAMKLFPEASRWPVPEKFSEHMAMQKYSGHSDFIARKYDLIRKTPRLPS